jgi:hypothetical protein
MATIPQRGRAFGPEDGVPSFRHNLSAHRPFRSSPALVSGVEILIPRSESEDEQGSVMKLVHTAAQGRRFDAFNDLAGDFLKMLGVAVLSGLFFSLVAGLVVFIVASEAYASPPQEGSSTAAATQSFPGGGLLLARENGQLHPANLIETDVYASVTQGKAMVRVTQTFANAGAAAKGGQFVFEAPANAAITRLLIQTDAGEREIFPSTASSRVEYLLDAIDTQNMLSVVVAYEQTLDIFADQHVRIPFTDGGGALNLMIDLESAAEFVTASDPLATIERNGGTHVVSLIDRPLPHAFELCWTAPTQIARSAREE